MMSVVQSNACMIVYQPAKQEIINSRIYHPILKKYFQRDFETSLFLYRLFLL